LRLVDGSVGKANFVLACPLGDLVLDIVKQQSGFGKVAEIQVSATPAVIDGLLGAVLGLTAILDVPLHVRFPIFREGRRDALVIRVVVLALFREDFLSLRPRSAFGIVCGFGGTTLLVGRAALQSSRQPSANASAVERGADFGGSIETSCVGLEWT
jgi:hypothetical protein